MRRGLLALSAMLALLAANRAPAVELEGTWYVLVHYKDAHADNADRERWEDRVWVFEKEGRGLRWTEYPIVVFGDESGRFERRQSGQYARILHFWEPSEPQLLDIRDGLQVNTRGSKTKTLRGSEATGWSSGRRAGGASASVVTYQEVWSIEGSAQLPVFRRSDFMGGGRTDTLEGVTEYATTQVEDGELSGTYDRDGSRRGVFRMLRSGAVGAVEGAETQQELQQKVMEREFERALQRSALNPPETSDESELLPRGAGGEDLQALRAAGERPLLPRQGMRLDEVVAALRSPPTTVNRKPTVLRKLEVLRLRPDGFDPIPAAEVESGVFRPAQGESYGVLALAYCDSGISGEGEHTSWYLLPGGGLAAWDHYESHDECVYSNQFQPATGEAVALEHVITARRQQSFPSSWQPDFFFYRKGIQLALAGRVDDAKRMLTLGDENLTADVDGSQMQHTSNRARLGNRSTDAAARKRLVDAIEVAEQAAGTSAKSP